MPEPADPITGLAEHAAQLHEMFLAFQHAGFTENQALELVIALAIHGNSDG
ncbi:hypothetical protein [Streptomyces sp. NPDC051173]|uniref:hypothetical protein n=1 Tax=Streptomyces sp. NPDC051173 TaxID=3155164 RepID=UPI00344FE0FD